MTQVTVNGNTYSDDGSSSKDMQNDRHRLYLFPMISDVLVDTASKVAAAAVQANNAANSAIDAATSATTAANAPGTSATSTTSLSISTGSKSLTIQTGKLLVPGMPVVIASTSTPSNYMAGSVTSYNSGSGALVVNVTNISGSGTVAAWTVSLTGVPGITGVLNELKATNIASAATVNLDSATGNLVHITGTVNITAFTLAAGSRRTIVFDDVLTITNSANVQCPANQNIVTAVGDMCTIYGDGSGVVLLTDYIKKSGLPNYSIGLGGGSLPGNTTLTSSSPGSITIAPTTYGQYLKFPNATTLTNFGFIYSIYNNSQFDLELRDNSDNTLGWIRPQSSCMAGLTDNSTSYGLWTIDGVEKLGIKARFSNTTLPANTTNGQFRCVTIDSSRFAFIFGRTSIYAVIYNKSTQQWGSITLIGSSVSGSPAWEVMLSASDQLLLAYANGSTIFTARTVTISGLSLTPNSVVTRTVTDCGQQFCKPIQVGSSFVFGWASAGYSSAIICITVLGTVPTIGSESVISGYISLPSLFAIGSVLCVFVSNLNSESITCTPYSISGVSATIGTAANFSCPGGVFRISINTNGNFLVHSAQYIAIVRLSGTSLLASTYNDVAGGVTSNLNNFCHVHLPSGRSVIIYNSGSNTLRAYIITDTSGTLTVIGSPYVQSFTNGTILYISAILNSLINSVHIVIVENDIVHKVTFDCSGATPVVFDVLLDRNTIPSSVPTPSNYENITNNGFLFSNNAKFIGPGYSNYYEISSSNMNKNKFFTPIGPTILINQNELFSYSNLGNNQLHLQLIGGIQ